MRRAAISIPSNIAEGAARDSAKEFSYFLSNAQGSAGEIETQILIAQKLGYLSLAQQTILRRRIDDVSRMIIGLQRSVRRQAK
jgi:four helix bundle protein